MKELLNLYFSIKLNKIRDPSTGELIDDWDTFWDQRLALESSIPPEYQKEWNDYLSRNSTPMEKLRRIVRTTSANTMRFTMLLPIYRTLWSKT